MPPDPLDHLRAASADLLYPSESDEPLDVFQWPPAPSAMAALADHTERGRKIEQVPIADFFAELLQGDAADRWTKLKESLHATLRDPSIYRVGAGEVEVDIYLIGRIADNGWAGLHTKSVET